MLKACFSDVYKNWQIWIRISLNIVKQLETVSAPSATGRSNLGAEICFLLYLYIYIKYCEGLHDF